MWITLSSKPQKPSQDSVWEPFQELYLGFYRNSVMDWVYPASCPLWAGTLEKWYR